MKFFKPSAGWRALALAALTAAAGCIDYQETIVVKADGSVELTVYAIIVNAALPMVKNRPELKQLLLLPVDPDGVKKLLPSSVKIKHWQVEDGPGIRIVDAAVVVASLDELQAHMGAFASSQNFKIYRDNEGNYHYEREVPAYPINEENGLSKPLLEKQLANSNLEFSLTVPTRILSSNGRSEGQKTVRWQTNLIELRQAGLAMQASIEPPPETNYLTLAAAILVPATLLGMALGRRWRRRRTAGSPELQGPLE